VVGVAIVPSVRIRKPSETTRSVGFVEEFVCLSVRSKPGETVEQFSTRLSQFWSAMLREIPDDFEKVYAESIKWESEHHFWIRKYLVEGEVIPTLESRFQTAGVDYLPIDLSDVYSKYEAVPSEWMQIEH
jgi:hypothetical protein